MSAERYLENMINNFTDADLGLQLLEAYIDEIYSSYKSAIDYLEHHTNVMKNIIDPLKDNILPQRKSKIENIKNEIENLRSKIKTITEELEDEKMIIKSKLG